MRKDAVGAVIKLTGLEDRPVAWILCRARRGIRELLELTPHRHGIPGALVAGRVGGTGKGQEEQEELEER